MSIKTLPIKVLPIKALILAAGQGSRLRPLTDDKPKCLVPLVGRSLLERQTQTLKQAGIDNIHVVAGYRAEQIAALGFEITVNPRFAATNMVESLFSALAFIDGDEDLIISYGDIVYQSNNLQTLLAHDDDIVLMIDKNWLDLWSIRFDDPLDDAETLVLDEHKHIVAIGQKPQDHRLIQGQYTGLIKVKGDKIREFIDFYQQLDRTQSYDGNDFDNMYMTSFLQSLIDSGWQVKAAEVENGWLEVDSVADLNCYETLAASGQLQRYYKEED